MAIAEQIRLRIERLPERMQAEVLHFVEFLLSKVDYGSTDLSDEEWSDFSLRCAMQGMEDEEGPEYTRADLKDPCP